MVVRVAQLGWLGLLALVFLAGCAAQPEPISLSWEADTPDTWLGASMLSNDQAQFTVGSRSDIGRGRGIIQSQRLPSRIVFALRAQRPAAIRLAYGKVEILATIDQARPNTIRQRVFLTSDDGRQDRRIGPASPYWMPMRLVSEADQPPRLPLISGYVEFDVPPDAYTSNQHTFTVAWQEHD